MTTTTAGVVSAPALLFGADLAGTGQIGGTPNSTGADAAAAGGEETGGAVTHVLVHPLVVFHILDHHTRRQEAGSRVIGTLLGRRTDSTTAEITNVFSVPHAERGDEVAIGKDFNRTMLSLHTRTNRREIVVGWYATTASSASSDSDSSSNLLPDTSSLIHEFYAGEADDGDPIHLVVDTRLAKGNDNIPIRAYRSVPIVIQGEHLGNLFHEVRLSLHSNEPETICLHEMIASNRPSAADEDGENGNKDLPPPSSDDALQVSMEKLDSLLASALKYVDSVVEGKIPADAETGRLLADTLATVPRVRPDVFDRIFHDSLQDLLMVTYLSNITRTQITIAEKLNASLGA